MKREKLIAARYSKGWTQEQVSEHIGVTRNTLSQWELGKAHPYPLHVARLCEVYASTAEKLGLVLESGEQEITSDMLTLISSPERKHEPCANDTQDWGLWFGEKLADLLSLIADWQDRVIYCEQLQMLLDREIFVFDALQPQDDRPSYMLSRRQALITLATLPTALSFAVSQSLDAKAMADKFLAQSAAGMTAFWHLLQGSEFPFIERTLLRYLPTLATLAQQSSRYQKTAAQLASQGYRILGIVALHRHSVQAKKKYTQQSLYFGQLAEDASLIVASALTLGTDASYYEQDPVQAMHYYEQASTHIKDVSQLQQARLYTYKARAHGQQG